MHPFCRQVSAQHARQHAGVPLKADSLNKANFDSLSKFEIYLKEVSVVAYKNKTDIMQLPDVVGTNIYAGKKSALILVDNVQGNVVTNTMRQVVAKVPGMQIWESDGSGIQIGLGSRGLSPNRSWEMNVRQNGYDIEADPYGYPEAYYNPQLQAVQQIEIIRGHGSLQYGPQFGGLVNYILKDGSDIRKPFQYETFQTFGSNGLFNSYNAIGGDTKNFHYYGFFDHRNSDGWRDNSKYKTNVCFGTFTYRLSNRTSVTAEYTHSNILSQQPGGLTEEQIKENAKMSNRSRNWLGITWQTAAVVANHTFKAETNTRLNVRLYGVFGNRGDIGFLKPLTINDTINPATLEYNNRQVQQDIYTNFGMETRFLTDYKWKGRKHTFSAGVRYFHGNTDRSRLGVGDRGTEFNTNFLIKQQELDLHSYDQAIFFENLFRITDRLSVIPGLRYQHLIMTASGRLSYNSDGSQNFIKDDKRVRDILLPGIGAEYKVTSKTRLYTNYTQAFRPIMFYDVSLLPNIEVIDPDLEDSKGYNFDLGYRGKVYDYLFFDMSTFILQYNNRIGTSTEQRSDGSTYYYRTNVGNSTTKGFEGLVEVSPMLFSGKPHKFNYQLFMSYSFTDARYDDFTVNVFDYKTNTVIEKVLNNNMVENAPKHILRSGITGEYKKFSISYQFSYVSESYADANNTVADPTAITGLIPSYAISDLHATVSVQQNIILKAGINNLADARYFTRRANAIPGPGAMPADGRSFYISIGGKF